MNFKIKKLSIIQPNNKKILLFLTLFITTFIFNFYKINSQNIQFWDEGTNALILYNLDKEPSIKLQLFDENFFEKPPLWYYLGFFSIKFFGFNEIGVRFVSSLASFFIVFLIFIIIKKKYDFYSAIFASFFLLSIKHLFIPNLFNYFSSHTFRSADLDSLHILFIILSFYFLWQNYKVKQNLLLAGLFSGLAVLTKGPFGILPVFIFFIYRIYYKEITKKDFFIFLTFFITILPWHLFMIINFGETFISNYLNYHILARSIQSIEGHSQNVFYYFSIILNPVFFPLAIVNLVVIINFFKQKTKDFFLFTNIFSILFILILITIIPTKLAWYLFYIYPFCAIIAGYWINIYKNKLKYILFSIMCITISIISTFFMLNTENKSPLPEILKTLNNNEYKYLYKTNPDRSDLFYVLEYNFEFTNKTDKKSFFIIKKEEFWKEFNYNEFRIIKNFDSYLIIKEK